MENKIEVRNLDLFFGKKQVLKGVHLTVPKNRVVALIGPSGCGKSTLLRSINRMHDLSPDAKITGDVLLDGKSVYSKNIDVVEIRRHIGMVFQKPNPFPKSIFENVAYGLKINGERNKAKLQEKVEIALKSSYLWNEVKDDLNKSALSLSGGQQQRLCIARAVAVEPEVILMDEPCSALDPISTAKIEELIVQLKQDFTIIIVTHNMQQAQRISDFTAVMYLGDLIEFGTTTQIFNAPQAQLTKDYVGGNFG